MIVYICYGAVLVPSLIAVVYGIAAILHRLRGLYFSMGVLAVVCLLVGQLAYCASAMTGHSETREFQIGSLGAMGSCLFFLTANMGPVNSLTDDSRPEIMKYRYLALLGPGAVILVYGVCVLIMARQSNFTGLISGLLLTGVTAVSVYYSTKMTCIPDIEGGFADCMRSYNGVVTILGLLTTLERGVRNLLWEDSMLASVLYIALYGAIGLSTLAAMIFLKKGAERWKTI